MKSANPKVVSELQDLRRDLNELHDSLQRVDIEKLNSGTAVLFQFIALRMAEIAKSLSEMAGKDLKGSGGSSGKGTRRSDTRLKH